MFVPHIVRKSKGTRVFRMVQAEFESSSHHSNNSSPYSIGTIKKKGSP